MGKREKREDFLCRFINVTVEEVEKKTNRIVIREGQELFEFPLMFTFSLEVVIIRKENLSKQKQKKTITTTTTTTTRIIRTTRSAYTHK